VRKVRALIDGRKLGAIEAGPKTRLVTPEDLRRFEMGEAPLRRTRR
jgi:hypothetical protein